jgi:hypothetical protein
MSNAECSDRRLQSADRDLYLEAVGGTKADHGTMGSRGVRWFIESGNDSLFAPDKERSTSEQCQMAT